VVADPFFGGREGADACRDQPTKGTLYSYCRSPMSRVFRAVGLTQPFHKGLVARARSAIGTRQLHHLRITGETRSFDSYPSVAKGITRKLLG